MGGLPLDDSPDLSPRQRQILDLLRAGKVNKEIASELGIGLGTVKQHMVAIFKKLKVRNRAAAVSCDLQRGATPASQEWSMFGGSLLERRPCVVLSLLLPGDGPESLDEPGRTQALMRLLHQSLAACAFDHDAVFLARQQGAGDLIFGIRGASMQDVHRAVLAARLVHRAVRAHDPVLAERLQGALSAGLAVISINRRGAWSGEAMASAAIAEARDLAASALPGGLKFSPGACRLMRALGPVPVGPFSGECSFSTVDGLSWQEMDAGVGSGELHDRDQEIRQVLAWLTAARDQGPGVLALEGEIGMGKSALCRGLVWRIGEQGLVVRHAFVQQDLEGPVIRSLPHGGQIDLAALFESEASSVAHPGPDIVILDDADLLDATRLAALIDRAQRCACPLLLAGRRFPDHLFDEGQTVRLKRLSPAGTLALMRALLSDDGAGAMLPEAVCQALVEQALGVPLFARELARAASEGGEPAFLPLPLRQAIAARLDPMGLDRPLLRHVAHGAGEGKTVRTGAELAMEIGVLPEHLPSLVEQAVSAGVLRRDEFGGLGFAHPLLRQAILNSEMC